MKKLLLHGMTPRQIIALIILAAADVFVIAAPYYIKNIIPNLHLYLNISEDQVATLTSIIGYVTLITQLPGGFLANKFSSKWLLWSAVFSTGLLTIWFGVVILESNNSKITQTTLFAQYATIWALWGISTTLVFWTPLWKLVSQQTTKENQGLAYGIEGTASGLLGVLFIFLTGVLITTLWSPVVVNTEQRALPFAVYAFLIATLLITSSFLILFFVSEKPIEKSIEKLSWTKIKKELIKIFTSMKNWKLWGLSIFLMGMYTFQSVFAYYLVQLMQNAFLAPMILVTILGGIRTYALRALVSTFVGKWADKFKSYILFLIIATGIGILIVGSLILLGFAAPTDETMKLWVIILCAILFIMTGILSWTMVTLRYTQIGEIHLEKNTYASSIGVLSFIGFSTDAWLYQITAVVGKHYTEEGSRNTSILGYQIILLICLGIALIGLLAAFVVYISNVKEIKKLGKTSHRWRTLENA
ncbi:MFS transporter [Mycoplasma phocimorsus]|uniref:MFS transporter n=1 Tax=Mycoplasma phocimorsus TaxID=3045839 RepID=A0AAJ1PRH7_9MOLU|nr:MFS transporter [Mycoplasma phocimorsus]MDJ1645511.1 MFS transporter [Mycoplasma phocimorsus]MDJ1646205.1 MFS transporter [Mycoplasma phocimorsus]MDJ1646803.1 MFS transporter [Mycoplasma phocimorsus]MDJ1647777.1 MFS transporter [Mycoplasma phocimorsus]MDJ1648191.1 MFS transporter [Mycoplasma phocimorsus]